MGDGTNVFIWLVSRVIGNHHLALREPAAAGTLNRPARRVSGPGSEGKITRGTLDGSCVSFLAQRPA